MIVICVSPEIPIIIHLPICFAYEPHGMRSTYFLGEDKIKLVEAKSTKWKVYQLKFWK